MYFLAEAEAAKGVVDVSAGNWWSLTQAALWPFTVLILAGAFRRPVQDILSHLGKRIADGDTFSFGREGLKLESPREILSAAEPQMKEAFGANVPSGVYLRHEAVRAPDLDEGRLAYFRLKIWLDADLPEGLDKVEKVTYYLHPTFEKPIREKKNRSEKFLIRTQAWGEFNLRAEVHFQGGESKPLERYITLF